MDILSTINSHGQASRNYVSMLEERNDIPKNKREDIQSLFHAIQHCPEDVLRIIFQYATQASSGGRNLFQAATKISHVCKIWRAVSLEMSSLWTSVSISMKDSVEDTSLFVERTRARLGTAPADIDIRDIGERPIELMKEVMTSVGLHKFKAISNLNYQIEASDDLIHLTNLSQFSTSTRVDHVGITQDLIAGQCPNWNGTCILMQFPSLRSLLLDVVANVTFSSTETYTTLSILKIRGRRLGIPSISPQVLRFPELRELLIGNTVLDLQNSSEDIIMPQLCRLTVWAVRGFPWNKISAPRLEQVETSYGETEEVTDFFCRHPFMSALMCSIGSEEESFKRLARSLVNLEFLGLNSSPEGLYKGVDSTVPFPPFPKLKELVIDNRRDQLSLSEFETFVRDRFLSQKTANVVTLTKWKIFINGKELEELPWYRSALMDHLQVEEEKVDEQTDLCCLTLRLK